MIDRYMSYTIYRLLPDGGIILIDRSSNQPPKDNPITVKGNSRQEIVQGKRHSWPVTKKRKGDR